MKKIIVLFVSVLLMFCMTGCSKAVDWDKDIKKLEDVGFVLSNDFEDATKSINADIKIEGGDFAVEVIKAAELLKDNDYDYQCILIQFATNEQAKKYYDLRIENRIEGSKNKFYVYEDVVIIVDNALAGEILGYDFK